MNDKPQEKPTVEIEKPPAWAISLSENVAAGFASVDARLDTVESNVEILVDDKKATNERLSRIETWRENEVNARLNSTSERVRETSEVNLKQDAVIAQIYTMVEEIKAKPDTAAVVLTEVKGLAKTPTGQKIVGAIVTVLLLSLTLLAANLQRKVDAIEDRPATVQPAPTVYLPVTAPPAPPADGGVP